MIPSPNPLPQGKVPNRGSVPKQPRKLPGPDIPGMQNYSMEYGRKGVPNLKQARGGIAASHGNLQQSPGKQSRKMAENYMLRAN